MIFSTACSNAIRASLYVAASGNGQNFVPIREISGELGISFHFLTKILQSLTQQNIMTSFRGPRGGISLARPPSEISLYDIVIAIDGPQLFQSCILGLDHCGEAEPCPLHNQWIHIRQQISDMLQGIKLDTLSNKIESHEFRLNNRSLSQPKGNSKQTD